MNLFIRRVWTGPSKSSRSVSKQSYDILRRHAEFEKNDQ